MKPIPVPLPTPVAQLRLAGVLYLTIILCGVGSELALRGPLIDMTSASATAQAILDHAARFRVSILADVVMAVADAALAVMFFLLFRPVAPGLALAAMVFRLLQSGVIAANLLHLQSALLVVEGGASSDHALRLIELHAYGYDLGLVFFAVNCGLTALLIVRSGFVPRWLGVGIAASGAVYLTGSMVRFLSPDLVPFVALAYGVPLLAESTLCLWLLVSHRRRTAWQVGRA